MRAQLGEIIGWMGKGIAILTLLGTAFIVFIFNENSRFANLDVRTYWTVIVIGCVAASVVFLIGQALRYILIRGK
jgi:hypothetical protein